MSTKHTPGPWVGIDPKTGKFRDSPWDAVNERVKSSMAAPIKSGRATVALAVMAGWENKDELNANASLIAAAPELLMALQLALPALEYLRKQFPRSEHDDSIDALAVSKAAIAKATGDPQ